MPPKRAYKRNGGRNAARNKPPQDSPAEENPVQDNAVGNIPAATDPQALQNLAAAATAAAAGMAIDPALVDRGGDHIRPTSMPDSKKRKSSGNHENDKATGSKPSKNASKKPKTVRIREPGEAEASRPIGAAASSSHGEKQQVAALDQRAADAATQRPGQQPQDPIDVPIAPPAPARADRSESLPSNASKLKTIYKYDKLYEWHTADFIGAGGQGSVFKATNIGKQQGKGKPKFVAAKVYEIWIDKKANDNVTVDDRSLMRQFLKPKDEVNRGPTSRLQIRVRDREESIKSARHEIRIISSLNKKSGQSPYICEYLAHVHNDEMVVLFMELAHGDLGNLMSRWNGGYYALDENLTQERCERRSLVLWDAWHDLLEALKYIHGQDQPLVHRDVKPDNILFFPASKNPAHPRASADAMPKDGVPGDDGKMQPLKHGWTFKLADFGLTAKTTEIATGGLGTRHYIPKEVHVCANCRPSKHAAYFEEHPRAPRNEEPPVLYGLDGRVHPSADMFAAIVTLMGLTDPRRFAQIKQCYDYGTVEDGITTSDKPPQQPLPLAAPQAPQAPLAPQPQAPAPQQLLQYQEAVEAPFPLYRQMFTQPWQGGEMFFVPYDKEPYRYIDELRGIYPANGVPRRFPPGPQFIQQQQQYQQQQYQHQQYQQQQYQQQQQQQQYQQQQQQQQQWPQQYQHPQQHNPLAAPENDAPAQNPGYGMPVSPSLPPAPRHARPAGPNTIALHVERYKRHLQQGPPRGFHHRLASHQLTACLPWSTQHIFGSAGERRGDYWHAMQVFMQVGPQALQPYDDLLDEDPSMRLTAAGVLNALTPWGIRGEGLYMGYDFGNPTVSRPDDGGDGDDDGHSNGGGDGDYANNDDEDDVDDFDRYSDQVGSPLAPHVPEPWEGNVPPPPPPPRALRDRKPVKY